MKKFLTSVAMIALLTAGVSSIAQAQNTDPNHPRVNEVDQRLQNQQNRTDAGVKNDQIGSKQEMRDNKRDAHVSRELSRDEAKNRGHITRGEQARMNRQLNRNSRDIHQQREARRNEPYKRHVSN